MDKKISVCLKILVNCKMVGWLESSARGLREIEA